MSRLSVIVVSFNTKEQLRRCLASLGTQHEIIVVDNASADGSVEMVQSEFPAVKIIQNKVNRGFGIANNQGLESMTGEMALLLNSDATAHPGAINRLVEIMSDSSVIACGGRLVNVDGSTQQSCCNELTLWALFCEQTYLEKIFPNSSLFSPYWISNRVLAKSDSHPHQVSQLMGACLMVRKDARFDERFFLYCEDTELCKRLSLNGRILYVPNAVFTHELGSSSQQRWMAIARYNRGKELYFHIHRGRATSVAAFVLNRSGALLRLVAWTVLSLLTIFLVENFRMKATCFFKVLFAPMNGPK